MMKMNIQKDVWEVLTECTMPIVLYGTGNGADRILDELQRLGITVSGVMASDGFVRERTFRGFTVSSLAELERQLGSMVILIAFGTQRPEVIDNILSVADKHTVLCADVPVYGDNIFNMQFYLQHENEIQAACSLMCDELSRRTFEDIISFKLSGRMEYLTGCFSEKDEAFRNILRLGEDESYLDLGAYRGDTIAEFLSCTNGKYSHITALEPDRRTFRKLREYAASMPETQLFNMGIWSEDCDLSFNASLGRGSSIQKDGSQTLPVTRIDTLYKRRRLTYLKADVEGSEEQAILGGEVTLRRDKPKLNIALYHRSEDIFHLPLLINSINPGYRFYIRQHPHIPSWDLNLYAN